MWTHDAGCFETIKKAWDHPTLETGMPRLLQKINQCHSQLGRWSKTQFGVGFCFSLAHEEAHQIRPKSLVFLLTCDTRVLIFTFLGSHQHRRESRK